MRIEQDLLLAFKIQGTTEDFLRSQESDGSLEIILASESKNRIALLRKLGITFTAVPSNFDEKSLKIENPYARALQLARMKAYSVAASREGIIIGADTFNIFDGLSFEKPETVDNAVEMLKKLSGKTGESTTGVCVLNTQSGTEVSTIEIVQIKCRDLEDDEISRYVLANPVTEWAATYNPLVDASREVFESLTPYPPGMDYGLPLDLVVKEFQNSGIAISGSVAAGLNQAQSFV